jgi:hypothetical protein
MSSKIAIVVVALLLSPLSSVGQGITMLGIGQSSCGVWLAKRSSEANRAILLNWVLGFISGSNWSAPDKQSRPPDTASVAAFFDQYCQNNPCT